MSTPLRERERVMCAGAAVRKTSRTENAPFSVALFSTRLSRSGQLRLDSHPEVRRRIEFKWVPRVDVREMRPTSKQATASR